LAYYGFGFEKILAEGFFWFVSMSGHCEILMSFMRSVLPLMIFMFWREIWSSFERKRMSSSLALPFSGVALRRILYSGPSGLCRISVSSVLELFGVTFMRM